MMMKVPERARASRPLRLGLLLYIVAGLLASACSSRAPIAPPLVVTQAEPTPSAVVAVVPVPSVETVAEPEPAREPAPVVQTAPMATTTLATAPAAAVGSTGTVIATGSGAPALQPEVMRFLDSVHPLAIELMQRGAVECAPRAQQLMGILSQGQDITLLQLSPDAPQQTLAAVSVLYPAEAGRVRFASLALAPGQANGCGASFQAIQVFGRICPQVMAADFPERAFQAAPGARAWLSSLSDTDLLIALELNPGCLLIRQQLIY